MLLLVMGVCVRRCVLILCACATANEILMSKDVFSNACDAVVLHEAPCRLHGDQRPRFAATRVVVSRRSVCVMVCVDIACVPGNK